MSFLANKQMKTNLCQRDRSAGKDTCHQARRPEFNPGLHMVEGENLCPQIVLGTSTGTHSHTYKRNKCKKNVAFNLRIDTNKWMIDGIREVNLPFNVLCEVSSSNVSWVPKILLKTTSN